MIERVAEGGASDPNDFSRDYQLWMVAKTSECSGPVKKHPEYIHHFCGVMILAFFPNNEGTYSHGKSFEYAVFPLIRSAGSIIVFP